MTRDDVLRIADPQLIAVAEVFEKELIAFANTIIEECAKACDAEYWRRKETTCKDHSWNELQDGTLAGLDYAEQAVRALKVST